MSAEAFTPHHKFLFGYYKVLWYTSFFLFLIMIYFSVSPPRLQFPLPGVATSPEFPFKDSSKVYWTLEKLPLYLTLLSWCLHLALTHRDAQFRPLVELLCHASPSFSIGFVVLDLSEELRCVLCEIVAQNCSWLTSASIFARSFSKMLQ